ncbi:anthranilate 1,2-dioxygenase small subunit AndAd [Burkholderia gladioli]|uniref:Aromatic-ring-hydroxylating dioxygenase subunit beta n=1 Tax=Burkholderia gladioli TaxID=28095 RepID=A0AB38U1P9_BURGA|nr:anthranilate 1,2-dioxygenase small subunit AndAd [Burkholderia gladioli]MBU9277748.1 aromatic-ring-hydroxylating dioxygenase subunit beta [Burkholderia gladioli]MBU9319701.1 aromatic-ring-hydroxylating dioxygenase subunit beta [Burkholderia gladioli]MBU9684847.1 aromatic-ring-hydroxylating dioxygenase subunit beta [Burkholderia gladioli]MCA8167099.1 aromatic-ring-hydroxylating dioxygenase subunit beta [Burkholderia gladioli]MDD1784939.1 aromatic-ring-hydroxylating dioxygenase subunit beta [
MTDDISLWLELTMLQNRYLGHLDNNRLESWPEMFTEDCLYEIVPKENADLGLPIGIIHCSNRRMLRDRVVSLRHANIYDAHTYRHMTSGLTILEVRGEEIDTESNYVVVQTKSDGESHVYQAGRYLDTVVRTPEGLRYRAKRVIYDTSRVQTLLATPI